MSTNGLSIAWVSDEGAVYGLPQALQLALPPGAKVWRAAAAPEADAIVCIYNFPRTATEGIQHAMAYSLQSGAAMWPAPVECDSIAPVGGVLVGGEHVWVSRPIEVARLDAIVIATGEIVASLEMEEADTFAIVTHGTWKNHLLCNALAYVAMYKPASTELVWRADKYEESWVETICVARGDWCIPILIGSTHLDMYSLTDGSVCPMTTALTHQPWPPTKVWPTGILVAWSPERFLVHDDNTGGNYGVLEIVDGAYIYRRASRYPRTAARMHAAAPRGGVLAPPVEVIVFRDECILFVSPVDAAILKTCPTPGIITAWHWTVPQCVRHEREVVDAAVAVIDDLSRTAADPEAVGLVRAVLVGFLAEDARLAELNLRR